MSTTVPKDRSWEDALALAGGDEAYLREQIGCFLMDVEGDLSVVRKGARGDLEALAGAGERIGNGAEDLGVPSLARAGYDLAEEPGPETADRLLQMVGRWIVWSLPDG